MWSPWCDNKYNSRGHENICLHRNRNSSAEEVDFVDVGLCLKRVRERARCWSTTSKSGGSSDRSFSQFRRTAPHCSITSRQLKTESEAGVLLSSRSSISSSCAIDFFGFRHCLCKSKSCNVNVDRSTFVCSSFVADSFSFSYQHYRPQDPS